MKSVSYSGIEPLACVVFIGRTLEFMCKDRKATGKTLEKMLTDLRNRGEIPDRILDIANSLRFFRNIGAHADSTMEVSRKDAETLMALCEAILGYAILVPQIIPVPLISTAHIKGLYIMDEDDTTKPSSAGQRNHIRISKLDILVIFFVLTIAVLVSFVFDANLGVSVVIVFCASLAVRDAILAPYKTQTSEKIFATVQKIRSPLAVLRLARLVTRS